MIYYELVVSVLVVKLVYEIMLEVKIGCMVLSMLMYLLILNLDDVVVVMYVE